MGQLALVLTTALLLIRAAAPVCAQAKSLPPPDTTATNATSSVSALNRVAGYTAWDDDYFYIALQINKPTLNGKNSAAFSNPIEDDAALIALQTDDDRQAAKRTAHTYTIAASAVGGVQLYSGPDSRPLFNGLQDLQARLDAINKETTDPKAQADRRGALLGQLIKSQVTPQGAARATGAPATGYTVEIAIPWSDLGGRPTPGAKMGFNVAAQSISADSPALQSLSPAVKDTADLNSPAKWTEIQFSNAPSASTNGLLVCPRVFASRPVIDGTLSSGEWNGLSGFEFGERIAAGGGTVSLSRTLAARVHPEFAPKAPRPEAPLPPASTEPLPVAARQPQPVPHLVIALYDYWYQADPRKAAPVQHVVRPDGGTALAHHPLEGAGPWFSYDRADWHRHQLVDIRRAGVDVILPVYRGDARNRQLYADKGLTVLTAALQALRQAGQDYPQVALYLDTSALTAAFGDRPDLRTPAVQAALYGMIRDFYRRIPAPFRCTVPLSAANGGRPAYPVLLSDAGVFTEFDVSFVPYVRGRFAADFDGADLLILGDGSFKPKAALDGYFTETKEKGFQFDSSGWIKTASVGAGYDTTFVTAATETPIVRPRKDGDTYRSDWTAALSKRPDWVLLDGWNDFAIAADVAPTLETGYSTADLTHVYTRLFAGTARLGIKFLWNDVPAAMLPQQTYVVHVRAQNTGVEGWSPAVAPGQTPIAFAYRWLRDGQVVATGETTVLPAPVLAGQNVGMELPVRTSGSEGDYTLEISAVELGKRDAISGWIGDTSGGLTLKVPVHVGALAADSAWRATLVQTDLPNMLEAGSVYDVHATLRNDGTTAWRKADGARVTLRLYKTGQNSSVPTGPAVAAADATASLTEDVPPGRQTTVRLLVPLVDPEGQPLPAWDQEDLWTYTARWEVAAEGASNGQAGTVTGGGTTTVPVALVNFDFGVRFTADGTPAALPVQRRMPVRLSLKNVGPQIWKKESVRIGYHWYYEDGTEFLWEDETTPIPQDVSPGDSVNDLLAWVTAPPTDGIYWLVWDVKFGDMWASTAAGTRVYDQIVRQVQVVGGNLIMADLTKDYNLDGVTDDDNLAVGDFDGEGRTFPAALIPPFADASIAPSTMWLPVSASGPDSPRRISFRWGPKSVKEKNFIQCKGQRLELGKSSGKCRILHLLAASTGKDVNAEMKLIFQEPTSQSEDLYPIAVSRWDRPPSRGEEVAFLCRRHHERSGIQPGAVALYHYRIFIREPRKLVALQLPNAPEIKIAAITLEK